METIDKVLGTIQQAIEIEKFGYEFYTNMRPFVKDKDGHKLISTIANLEVDHIKWLEDEYKRQIDNIDSFDEQEIEKISITAKDEIFFKDKLPEIFRKFDAKKAINFAIEIENHSIEFYQKQMDLTNNDQVRDLFRKLADFEKKHITVLKDTLNSLENKDSWIPFGSHVLW